MSAIYTYVLFIACLGVVSSLTLFSLKFNRRIKDIVVSPVSIILSIFFFLALWLADLTTLDMGRMDGNWIHSTNALVPAESSQVPSIVIWVVCILGLFLINYYYHKITKLKANNVYEKVDEFLVHTQFVGLVLFTVFAIIMIFAGHAATFLGLYVMGIYHAMLPLIIIPQIVLALMIK